MQDTSEGESVSLELGSLSYPSVDWRKALIYWIGIVKSSIGRLGEEEGSVGGWSLFSIFLVMRRIILFLRIKHWLFRNNDWFFFKFGGLFICGTTFQTQHLAYCSKRELCTQPFASQVIARSTLQGQVRCIPTLRWFKTLPVDIFLKAMRSAQQGGSQWGGMFCSEF